MLFLRLVSDTLPHNVMDLDHIFICTTSVKLQTWVGRVANPAKMTSRASQRWSVLHQAMQLCEYLNYNLWSCAKCKPTKSVLKNPMLGSENILSTTSDLYMLIDRCLMRIIDGEVQWRILVMLGPDDHVRCFSCGGSLKAWQPADHPVGEHLRWFPDCKFIQQQQQFPSQTQPFVSIFSLCSILLPVDGIFFNLHGCQS